MRVGRVTCRTVHASVIPSSTARVCLLTINMMVAPWNCEGRGRGWDQREFGA